MSHAEPAGQIFRRRGRKNSRSSARLPGVAFVWVVGVLLALGGVILALGYLQGPRLLSAELDTDAVTDSSDQTLRLILSQSVSGIESGAVTVEPSAAVSVASEADLISVTFEEPLDYNTAYTVTVNGVESVSGASASTISYSFTTGGPKLYLLDRGESADEIVRAELGGSERSVLFAGEGIQEFMPFGDLLAVTTASADRQGTLWLVNPQTGIAEKVVLPEAGEVVNLDASRSGATLGFTISSDDIGPIATVWHTLYTIDFDRGRDAIAVTGLDGAPMRVTGWQFIPGTLNIVALTADGTLVRVDSSTGNVEPLGQYFEFDRVSADGSHVVVSDSHGSAAIALTDGAERELNASPIDGKQPFLGHTDAGAAGTLVAKMVLVGEAGNTFSSLLAYDNGEVSRILHQTVDDKGAILDFQVSPNGQLVAVEVQPNVSALDSDEYVMNPRPRSVTTYVVDIASGEVTQNVDGFGAVWR
ncbi:Ig-like domain-containing protein [Rhodoglobus aureus]|uniref:SbsA Ig-like domain-containing protein n=1 Tax=Rhodoglobus aureus TaxID=191497 RepID=A0ABP4FXF6_9MICO